VTVRLALDDLDEAGRFLEGGEACLRVAWGTRRATKPASGRDRAGDADRAAEREGAEPRAAVLPVHGRIVGDLMRVTTLGDLLLDVIVALDGQLVPGDDRPAVTRVTAGGQAANVAAWVVDSGGSARFVGKRGADAAGELVGAELRRRGVELAGPAEGRTGVVVSIAAAGERTMASDRGSAPGLAEAELVPAWFDCDVLHISGYCLHREPLASASARAAELAREHGARVAVDLSTWSAIDEAFRERVRALRPDVVFAGERERDGFGPLEASWVVKRGAAGVVVDGVEYAALEVEVVDTTGAGDAFAAGFLVGGVELGLEAAAQCCSQLGAMPCSG
jgi:sugar/nucleoside kinase (ribokinase family)